MVLAVLEELIGSCPAGCEALEYTFAACLGFIFVIGALRLFCVVGRMRL